jgi:glycosyltransferase involved in cell wall biosynthesis
MEGMASGCAIIATDVGAINLMVSPKNGILIQPMDASAIVNAIKNILAMDKEELFQLKLTSIKRTQEEFLWEHVILQEIDAIKKIL